MADRIELWFLYTIGLNELTQSPIPLFPDVRVQFTTVRPILKKKYFPHTLYVSLPNMHAK